MLTIAIIWKETTTKQQLADLCFSTDFLALPTKEIKERDRERERESERKRVKPFFLHTEINITLGHPKVSEKNKKKKKKLNRKN